MTELPAAHAFSAELVRLRYPFISHLSELVTFLKIGLLADGWAALPYSPCGFAHCPIRASFSGDGLIFSRHVKRRELPAVSLLKSGLLVTVADAPRMGRQHARRLSDSITWIGLIEVMRPLCASLS